MGETAAQSATHETREAPIASRKPRPEIVGPDTPEAPFPILLEGEVQRGFGRGGKDLGCPTANLPDESLPSMSTVTETGVYYGYAQVSPYNKEGKLILSEEESSVLPMVMSFGQNPFFKNKHLTAEIHIMHEIKSDFYGHVMKAVVLGYIRPELNYTTQEALIEDIETDKRVAMRCLEREGYQKFKLDPHFGLVLGPKL